VAHLCEKRKREGEEGCEAIDNGWIDGKAATIRKQGSLFVSPSVFCLPGCLPSAPIELRRECVGKITK
jgi:hypothetical protein